MSASTYPPATPRPPRRILAIGSAAAITAVTVAGAWGYGPGAAAGQSPTRDVAVVDTAGDNPTGGAAPASQTGPDGWLTVNDEAPATASREDDPAIDVTDLPARSGQGRRIVYDISAQRVWLVTAGRSVERTYPVSGARDESKVDPGAYEVYSTSRNAVSFNHKETMNYMVRFTHGDSAAIGFHDVPAFSDGTLAQSRAELGTPLSAGCIRQWITDARALWDFSDIGTRVVVTA